MRTLHIAHITNYGYLPSVTEEGREVYRGEFRDTPEEALEHAKRYFIPVPATTSTPLPGLVPAGEIDAALGRVSGL